jgi:hypothetical protein
MQKLHDRNSRGSVIVLAVFVVLFMGLLLFSVEVLHRSEFEDISNQVNEMRAYYCAEAGVERTISRLMFFNNNPAGSGIINWGGGQGTTPECNLNSTMTVDGTNQPIWYYKTSIFRMPSDPDVNWGVNNLIYLYSTGYAGYANGFQRTIEVVLRRSNRTQLNGDYFTQVFRWHEY